MDYSLWCAEGIRTRCITVCGAEGIRTRCITVCGVLRALGRGVLQSVVC